MEKNEPEPRVLLIGATGYLGTKVTSQALTRGLQVRALVRSGSSEQYLREQGVDVVYGDLLDQASLRAAMRDCSAVVSTAIGYSGRRPGDLGGGADTLGNRNLADAVLATGVGRLVFCSVLTCDKASDVPHFWNKKISEDYFRERGVPFVSLRPGAFLDQGPRDFWARGLKKGKLQFLARTDVPFSFTHTDHLARHLVAACSRAIPDGSVIDVSCDRPASISDIASLMTKRLGRLIKPVAPPWPMVKGLLTLQGMFDASKRDLLRMMAYIQRGGYVASTTMQQKYLGQPEPLEAGIDLYLQGIGLLGGRR